MKDRTSLIHEIEVSLACLVDWDLLQDIVVKVTQVVNNYEVTERCTAIVPVDDENQKLLKKYAACLYVDGRSRKTIEQYVYRIQDFYNKMQINLKDVGVYDIRMYLGLMKQKGASGSYLDGMRSYIAAFYKWMTLEGFVDRNPCETLKPIKFNSIEEDPFTDVELEKIREGCVNVRERALIEFLLSTGVRVSELCDMNVEDIDFDTRAIHVLHGKGDKERTTYISSVALYHMKRYLAERRQDRGNALFVTKRGRLNPGGVRFILKEIEERSGVENIHPHRFRHTFATVLSKAGMPIQHIQQLLGHTNLDTTMIYVAVDVNAISYEYKKYMNA